MSLAVAELAPGLWRWTAPHPDWTPEEYEREGWGEHVGCVYWEAPDAICVIDPLIPAGPDDRARFLAHLDADVERVGLPVAVLLTVFWHERDAEEVARRYSGDVVAPQPALERLSVAARGFSAGESLPGGLEAVDVARKGEVVYVVPSEPAALVAGDVLLGDDNGGVRVCPDDWFADPAGPAKARAALRPLLERPLALIVVSHGQPVTTDGVGALRRALDA